MEKNDGGQAFPCAGSEHNYPYAGMTLRDYFAAKAMASLLSNSDAMDEAADGCDSDIELMANVADRGYAMADAMLAAREVGK